MSVRSWLVLLSFPLFLNFKVSSESAYENALKKCNANYLSSPSVALILKSCENIQEKPEEPRDLVPYLNCAIIDVLTTSCELNITDVFDYLSSTKNNTHNDSVCPMTDVEQHQKEFDSVIETLKVLSNASECQYICYMIMHNTRVRPECGRLNTVRKILNVQMKKELLMESKPVVPVEGSVKKIMSVKPVKELVTVHKVEEQAKVAVPVIKQDPPVVNHVEDKPVIELKHESKHKKTKPVSTTTVSVVPVMDDYVEPPKSPEVMSTKSKPLTEQTPVEEVISKQQVQPSEPVDNTDIDSPVEDQLTPTEATVENIPKKLPDDVNYNSDDDDDLGAEEMDKPMEEYERKKVTKKADNMLRQNDFMEAEDSHFFFYFLMTVSVFVLGYVAFHNKNKILAFALEGKRSRGRRRPNSSNYRKLDCNLEEAMSSNTTHAPSSNIVY